MKKITLPLLIVVSCLCVVTLQAQTFPTSPSVGINTNTPDTSAALDVVSPNNNSGLLIPRMDSLHRKLIVLPAKSLLVFDTDKNQFYYNAGTSNAPLWTSISNSGASSGQSWSLTGNAGTIAGTNFLGTTDITPLEFRVFNKQSGYIDTLGNTSFGWMAGKIYKGARNTAFGKQAFASNLTGFDNTAIGLGSLFSNTGGTGNVATGGGTLYNNTTGYNNTADGVASLLSNTTGGFNTAVGSGSMQNNSTGNNNSVLGNFAMFSNTVGSDNVAVGDSALYLNTQGGQNTAVGKQALFHNIGLNRLGDGDLGFYNTAVGYQSLFSNSSGTSNVAVGWGALYGNLNGYSNVAIGNHSLSANFNGYNNVGIGYQSLLSNIDGYDNVAGGYLALFSNTRGFNNVAVGSNALAYNLTGFSNTAIGYKAVSTNTSGYGNVAVGDSALFLNNTGFNNTVCGLYGLSTNTAGSGNASFGAFAGIGSTGDYNTYIGNSATGFCCLTNSSALGFGATATTSNTIVLGNANIQFLRCAASLSNLSDRRLKTNIRDLKLGLNFINQLKPVTYEFIAPEKRGVRQTGLIAQEVEAAAINSGVYDFSAVDKSDLASGGYYGLKYAELTVPLIKAVQEIDAKNIALQKEMALMKDREASREARYAQQNQQIKELFQQIGSLKRELGAKVYPEKKDLARNK